MSCCLEPHVPSAFRPPPFLDTFPAAMPTTLPPTAALAGVPSGISGFGAWLGRRQAWVRFAGEAETAQMYTAAALTRELGRILQRGSVHSVCISGRDVLGNLSFVQALLGELGGTPVLLETDGQRVDEVAEVAPKVALLQVAVERFESDAMLERAVGSLGVAAAAGTAHALVLAAAEDTADAPLLRAVGLAAARSAATQVVIHPPLAATREGTLDRRWSLLLEQAAATHPDVRLLPRIPAPAGLR